MHPFVPLARPGTNLRIAFGVAETFNLVVIV